MPKKEERAHSQVTIYIPKHERNFMTKVYKFIKEEYPGESISWFYVMCVKSFINTKLTPTQKKRFRKIGYDLAGKEVPDKPDIVKKFRKQKEQKNKGE